MTATVRAVHDHAPTVGSSLCLRWLNIGGPRQALCCLPPGHDGSCLPLAKFPAQDISDQNPRWAK